MSASFEVHELVRLTGFTSFAKFNGAIGRVIEVIKDPASSCQPYMVELMGIGGGNQLITCACHMERYVHEGPDDFAVTVAWDQCAWKPHMKDLPPQTIKNLLDLAKIRIDRRNAEKRNKKK